MAFMKTVFMYAGQGSQHSGMGKDIYEKYPAYRRVLDRLELDFDIKKLMHEGDTSVLAQTEYTQPCMAAFAAGVTEVLKEREIFPDAVCGLSLGEYGALFAAVLAQTEYTQPCMAAFAAGVTEVLKEREIFPDAVCGLSLGEYGALFAAGVFSAEDYVGLTAFRGRAMADAARGKTCSMSAVLGSPAAETEEVCRRVNEQKKFGFVALVNYNCPGQYVICGDETAVAKAEALLKEMGVKRSIRLKVSGPFHTKYMSPAAERLAEELASVNFGKPKLPVVLNMTGDYYDGVSCLKEYLCMQIQNSVQKGWRKNWRLSILGSRSFRLY